MKHNNDSWFFLFQPRGVTQTGTHYVGQYLFQVSNKEPEQFVNFHKVDKRGDRMMV